MLRLNELVTQFSNLLNKKVKPIYAELRHGDIKHSFANINLIKKNLNFEPIVNFNDGLKSTIKNY